MAVIEIISTGVGISVQDFGRSGWRRFGVPAGGVMDRSSAAQANALLGNRDDAPVLEILMQGAKLRVLQDTWIALAGADLGCELEPWTAREVKAGSVLNFPVNRCGLWAYLALPGGIDAAQWLGSASVDARNGLGEVLSRGSQLSALANSPAVSTERVGRRVLSITERRDFSKPPILRLLPGPQFDLFSHVSRAQLVDAEWTVSARSDRTGYRLDGPVLEIPESIKSEPVLPGSFQIPGNGQPIITMNDGPTVGGYAKLAVLRESDLDWLAQCRPGTKVSFRWPLIINCDLGENESDAQTEALMAQVGAVNVCCGVHAGSEVKTRATLELAGCYGVRVGAHPGLPAAGGRGTELPTVEAFRALLDDQLGSFLSMAKAADVSVSYVKLHGSLYHAVEHNEALAAAYIDCIGSMDTDLGIFSLAGGSFAARARAAGIRVWEEVFADRGYTSAGQLVPRGQAGDVIEDASAAAERIRLWRRSGQMPTHAGGAIALSAKTVCVHSDSPAALQLLAKLKAQAGV
jgi:biotin-dependent carboxylase-like uncharacterized protein